MTTLLLLVIIIIIIIIIIKVTMHNHFTLHGTLHCNCATVVCNLATGKTHTLHTKCAYTSTAIIEPQIPDYNHIKLN